jgi:hypothetical protein
MKRATYEDVDEHLLATRKYGRLYAFWSIGYIEVHFPEDIIILLRAWLIQLQSLHQGYRIVGSENIPYSMRHVSCLLVSPDAGSIRRSEAIRINLYTTRISDLIALFTLHQNIPFYDTSFRVGLNTLPSFHVTRTQIGDITRGHMAYNIVIYYNSKYIDYEKYSTHGKEQWTLHDFLLFIGDIHVEENEVLIEKPLTFYRESYCDTCHRAACVTQRINEDGGAGSQRQCPYAMEGSLKCRRTGCCHGCDCILDGTTNHDMCSCDCHVPRNTVDQ